MARILIIEDEPDMLDLLTLTLEDGGFETTAARSGEEGVRSYEAARPDAVLLDLGLPRMDGLETLEAIRRIDLGARVAILTGTGTSAAVKEAMAAGAQDFVLKPFDLDRVLGAVEALLAA
jgi:DNA-binding response OmpR family regulator